MLPVLSRRARPPLNIGDENDPYASSSVGGAELALVSRDGMAEAVGTSALTSDAESKGEAAIIIDIPDVEADYDTVAARGGVFVNPPFDQHQWVVRCAHLRAPGGNLIERDKEMGA